MQDVLNRYTVQCIEALVLTVLYVTTNWSLTEPLLAQLLR